MRFTALLPSALLFLALLAAGIPTSQAKAQFFETTIVTDTANDNANGALDLVEVHVAEKYLYDPEKKVGKGEHLVFRFEPRSLSDIPCQSVVRYEVHFTANGTQGLVYAGVKTASPQDGCGPLAADGTGTVQLDAAKASVSVVVPASKYSIVNGTVLSKIWAESFLMSPTGDPVGQDCAPGDSQNLPCQAAPTDGLKDYVASGGFAFVNVLPVTPLAQNSVLGAEVKYDFQLVSDPNLSGDNIRVRFQAPTGWTVAPSSGTTGSQAEGQLTGGSNGQPREFFFVLSAGGSVSVNDTATVVMEVITDSGGHVNVTTVTTVTGSRIVDSSYDFKLLTPGPFKAGESASLKIQVDAPQPLPQPGLSVDVLQGTKRVASANGNATGNVYTVVVKFPGEGTYQLDAYLSKLKPSPHETFTVQVKGGGLSPGLAPLGIVAAFALALTAARRRG